MWTVKIDLLQITDVKSLGPKCLGQNFGLGIGLEALASASASASNIRPRPGLDLVVLSSLELECILKWLRYTDFSVWHDYYVIGHFSGKNRVKFGNFVNFSGINLKSYVVNHYLVLFHNYCWPRPWPQPPEIGLGLEVLASFNITLKNASVCVLCSMC